MSRILDSVLGQSARASTRRPGIEQLYKLSKLIVESVEKIDTKLSEENLDFPSLDTPFTPDSETCRALPEVRDAAAIISAAATQLRNTVCPPPTTIVNTAMQFNVSAAMNVVVDAHVAEIIREAGPQGLNVKDIAKPSGADPAKLSRIIRLLATYNIFRETAPDVFAHNRLSSLLDTGKPLETILKDPKNKHANTTGLVAAVGHITDDSMKSLSYLSEFILDPAAGHSNDGRGLPFNRAFSTSSPIWDFFERPEQEQRLRRFGMAMEGSKNMSPPLAIVDGVDWNGLGDDALVVDVGGGIGAQSLTLSKNCPNLKFIVQDREAVMEDAKKFWMHENAEALQSGRTVLQAHDFFNPQTVKNADVFLLRAILHDHPDDACLAILRHLRAAAMPTTQLIVVDNIIAHACDDPTAHEIPGAATTPPPAPLLANLGEASSVAYLMDIQLLGLTGGGDRTLSQVRDLLAEAGWKVTRVHHGAPFVLASQKVVAVPA